VSAPCDHIACCIDEYDGSQAALQEARRLRVLGPGRLSLVHVMPSPIIYGEALLLPPADEIANAAGDWLDGQRELAGASESVLLSGDPAHAVCDWARVEQPDLLVAGAHRGVFLRLALGSFATTSHTTLRARCCSFVRTRPDRAPVASFIGNGWSDMRWGPHGCRLPQQTCCR
jgi:nucleotide-binding universal stress UspA family protein